MNESKLVCTVVWLSEMSPRVVVERIGAAKDAFEHCPKDVEKLSPFTSLLSSGKAEGSRLEALVRTGMSSMLSSPGESSCPGRSLHRFGSGLGNSGDALVELFVGTGPGLERRGVSVFFSNKLNSTF